MRTWQILMAALLCVAGCSGGDVVPDGGGRDARDVVLVDLAPPADLLPLPDILVRLQGVPGLMVTEKTTKLTGYRFFQLTYDQPADHARPGGAHFSQRVTLLYRSDTAPTVLAGSGYNLYGWDTGYRTELTTLLQANQLDLEHRYFPPSQPQPPDWSLLTIQQAAADTHALVQALRPVVSPGRGAWISTGASKGGMTAVFHRRFYPADVDATVAYVAPLSLGGPDNRYIPFVNNAGSDAACRDKLRAFQRLSLQRKTELLAELAKDTSLTFTRIGAEKALEHAVLELPFAFWQYHGQGLCASVPVAGAAATAVYQFVDQISTMASYADEGVADFEPYYYQAATQLGWPGIEEGHVMDLLRYPGTDRPAAYMPVGAKGTYDPKVMVDIAQWVQTQGQRLLFVYGGNDPWSAGAFELGLAADSYRLTVPGGNHGSNLNALPEPVKSKALEVVRRWAGVPQMNLQGLRDARVDDAGPPPRMRP